MYSHLTKGEKQKEIDSSPKESYSLVYSAIYMYCFEEVFSSSAQPTKSTMASINPRDSHGYIVPLHPLDTLSFTTWLVCQVG